MSKVKQEVDVISEAQLFRETIEKTNQWLRELSERLVWDDPHRVCGVLRTTLHLLRDRLPVNEAVELAQEFPLMIKGLYFENWKPSRTPNRNLDRKGFSEAIRLAFPDVDDPELVFFAAFAVIRKHLSPGEAKDVGSNLPESLRLLWDRAAHV
jgi:uncharacterized protein (DUF2267 family)